MAGASPPRTSKRPGGSRTTGPERRRALTLVPSVQVEVFPLLAIHSRALRGGRVAPASWVEREADQLVAGTARVPQCGADPRQIYPIVWFVALAAGAYVLLRPGVANAPSPSDETVPSVSSAQVLLEAAALFAIPGGALALGARLGLGFLGRMALVGATANVSLRGAGDFGRGELSPPLLYLFDATTGAILGFVIPGGFRLIGRAGTQVLDRLATFGLSRSDIALTRTLAEQAAKLPLTADRAREILAARGLGGRVSQWWLDRRGVVLLYRGQQSAVEPILSPLARQEGGAASRALVARLRAKGVTDAEIAGYTARWHDQPVPSMLAPPGLAGKPLGAVGIPTTRLPGIAANFGDEGVIDLVRVPKGAAIVPRGWQNLALENEYVILNEVPPGSVVNVIPAKQVAPLMVDADGLLVPGR